MAMLQILRNNTVAYHATSHTQPRIVKIRKAAVTQPLFIKDEKNDGHATSKNNFRWPEFKQDKRGAMTGLRF